MLLTLLEAHTKIRNALKEVRPVTWMNKAVVMMLIALMGVAVFLINPGDVMGWLSMQQNQAFIVILAGVIGFVYFYAAQKRGR